MSEHDERSEETDQAIRRSPRLPDLPPGLKERVIAAVGASEVDQRGQNRGRAARRKFALPTLPQFGFGAGFGAIAVALVLIIFGGPEGELEVEATLAGTGASAEVVVREIGEGRTVAVFSDDLEILPTGDYYEVWFVGEGDSPTTPNRISAGTFHPNPDGVTDTTLFGAVDPAKLPRIEITIEPGDGDPAPSGDVVLSSG